MATMKPQIATVKLVYPPMSDQEAVWFEKDAEVEATSHSGIRAPASPMRLLPSAVETLGIQSFDAEADAEDMSLDQVAENKRVVADVKKAFVKLLDPQCNETKPPDHPKWTNRLYQAGFTRYRYVLGEDLIFSIKAATIKGAFDPTLGFFNAADCIFVEGDQVRHFVSGINLPPLTSLMAYRSSGSGQALVGRAVGWYGALAAASAGLGGIVGPLESFGGPPRTRSGPTGSQRCAQPAQFDHRELSRREPSAFSGQRLVIPHARPVRPVPTTALPRAEPFGAPLLGYVAQGMPAHLQAAYL